MFNIISPLELGDKGDGVAHLQDALPVLIKKAHIHLEPLSGAYLLEMLAKERVEKFYGEATAKLISIFRSENNLGDLTSVDDSTAAAIHNLLDELLLTPVDSIYYSYDIKRKQFRFHFKVAMEGEMRILNLSATNFSVLRSMCVNVEDVGFDADKEVLYFGFK